jgi:hypothetical protein
MTARNTFNLYELRDRKLSGSVAILKRAEINFFGNKFILRRSSSGFVLAAGYSDYEICMLGDLSKTPL